MPELPEVETVCRGLAKSITGKTLARLELRRKGLRFPFPRGMAQKCAQQRITAIRRRAKYILIDLANGQTLIAHLGMTGRMVIAAAGETYTPEKHDHVIFHLTDGGRVVFNDARRFGVLDIAPVHMLDAAAHFAHLGPEPLEDTFTPDYLAAKLATRKTPVKIAIMDQEVVVGVGNIYAAEALFAARIDPTRPAHTIGKAEIKKLWAEIRAVLHKAIDAGGSSIRDYVQSDGELGYFQHHWAVYGKEGEECPRCKTSTGKTPASKKPAGKTAPLPKSGGIMRITQGGRSTFYCPHCQK